MVALLASCVPPDDDFHSKLAAGCNTQEACLELSRRADLRVKACVSNAPTSLQCKSDADRDSRAAADLLEAQMRRNAALVLEGNRRARIKAYNDELAELRRSERIPDDSCVWLASLRAKAVMSPLFSTRYADLAQQLRDRRVLDITSQIQSALTQRISWPDLDDPATARDEIPRVNALVDPLWCYDASAALKAQTNVEIWDALREKGISDEQTCRATATCMGARIAVPLCQAIAIRRAAMRGIAQERANPAGVVDLNALHELGRQVQENASEGTSRLLQLPFVVDAVRLRTRFIVDFLREGLASGVCQVVLLGAGFDTRGLRLAEIAACQASVYEVDFAEQLEKKRALLDAAGVTLPARIAAVECDFMAPGFDDLLLVALGQSGFRRGERALFVWEGVIAYIDAAAVDRSLRFVVNAGGRGSRLAFDFAAGITFDPEPPAERLRGTGFTAFKAVGFDELWRLYRQPGEPHLNASVMQMGVAEV